MLRNETGNGSLLLQDFVLPVLCKAKEPARIDLQGDVAAYGPIRAGPGVSSCLNASPFWVA